MTEGSHVGREGRKKIRETYAVYSSSPPNNTTTTVVVYITFNQSEIEVDEGDGVISVCVALGNVTEPTQAQIWANVTSIPDSAMSEFEASLCTATVA